MEGRPASSPGAPRHFPAVSRTESLRRAASPGYGFKMPSLFADAAEGGSSTLAR